MERTLPILNWIVYDPVLSPTRICRMHVRSLAQFDPARFLRVPTKIGTDVQRLNESVNGLALSNDLSGKLIVRTEEGDTITLTAEFDTDLLAVNLASQSTFGNSAGRTEARYVDVSIRNSLDVAVEGNLNEQELKDLKILFNKISSIIHRFLKGEDEQELGKAAQLAHRFSNLSSLDGVEFNVEIERAVTFVTTQLAVDVLGPPRPASPTETAPPGGSARTEADTSAVPPNGLAPTSSLTRTADPANDIHVDRSVSDLPRSTSLADQLLTVFKESNLEPRKIHTHLSSIITRALNDLRRELRDQEERGSGHAEGPADPLPTQPITDTAAANAYRPLIEPVLSLTVRT